MEYSYELIEKFIKPKLKEECKRLNIPPDFIQDIVLHTRPGFKPIIVKGERKVVLFISEHSKSLNQMLSDFYYGMRLAKGEYEGKDVSNLRATLYSLKRKFENSLALFY